MEEIVTAAKNANIHGFISALPLVIYLMNCVNNFIVNIDNKIFFRVIIPV